MTSEFTRLTMTFRDLSDQDPDDKDSSIIDGDEGNEAGGDDFEDGVEDDDEDDDEMESE